MNIKKELEKTFGVMENIQLNDLEIDPLNVKAIMINEVVPYDQAEDFYGEPCANYLTTTIPLFQKAGFQVTSIQDILQMGIYITNAVKTPKSDYTIEAISSEAI
jgi:DNA-directed RNA polymerase beta' subunit